MEAFVLTREDRDFLDQALTDQRNLSINPIQQPHVVQQQDQSTSTVLVQVPVGGIPAMVTGTVSGSLGIPGYATCQVVQLNNSLVPPQLFIVPNYTIPVWNYTQEPIVAGRVILCCQNSYGEWVPVGTQVLEDCDVGEVTLDLEAEGVCCVSVFGCECCVPTTLTASVSVDNLLGFWPATLLQWSDSDPGPNWAGQIIILGHTYDFLMKSVGGLMRLRVSVDGGPPVLTANNVIPRYYDSCCPFSVMFSDSTLGADSTILVVRVDECGGANGAVAPVA